MANRGISTEQFNEEFNRLDQELKLLQKELDDTLQLNDNFQKSIEQKGDELAMKDEYLMSLREKNAAEIEQLKLEETSAKEHSQHEINFHTVELQNLTIRRQRLQELRNENERLRSCLNYLNEQTNKDRLEHALAMHEMNKEMKSLRQQMEQNLRKELAGLELSYQDKAFQFLQDKQKKAMLENAKLKDEVALQGVGIANLTSRLIKQQLAFEKCEKVLNKYEQKSQFLRERLAQATMLKNSLTERRDALQQEEQLLLQKKDNLTKQLAISNSSVSASGSATATAVSSALSSPKNRSSSSHRGEKIPRKYLQTTILIHDLVSRYTHAKEQYRSLLSEVKLWVQRYDQIKSLFIDLKPLDAAEKRGNYKRKFFPLKDLVQEVVDYIAQQRIIDPLRLSSSLQKMRFDKPLNATIESEHSSVTNDTKPSISSQGSEVILEIRGLIQQDPDLAEALKQLKGKESSLLTAFQSSSDQSKQPEIDGETAPEASEALEESGQLNDEEKEQEKDQNMVAWTVLKIINLWFGTERRLKAYRESSSDLEEEEKEGEEEEDVEVREVTSLSAEETSPDLLPEPEDRQGPLQLQLPLMEEEEGGRAAHARGEESMEEWEARMIEEIMQAREEDAQQLLSDEKEQVTGVDYFDHPPETSSWLFKPPPRPSRNLVFAEQIRQQLIPKISSVSVKERQQHCKDKLNLSDVGPPVVIHDFLSPLAKTAPASSPEKEALRASRDFTASTAQRKPKFQRKESQLFHYEAERDPLLFNCHKKNLTLPKSPKGFESLGSQEAHSIYHKKFVSDRSLPRKLMLALSRSNTSPSLASVKPATSGLSFPETPPSNPNHFDSFFLKQKKRDNGDKKRSASRWSHSTGALHR